MSENESDRAIIRGTSGDFVALTPLSKPPSSSGYGISTAVEVVMSSVRAEVTAELWYLGEFHKSLVALHSTLSGQAALWAEGEFEIRLRGNGRGNIDITGIVVPRYDPEVRLVFASDTDQTFLPELINSVHRVFLSTPPPGKQLYFPKSIELRKPE
jgi:hypothetical protein